MKNIFKDLKRRDHKRYLGGLDVFKYIGPGLLVTVGFIDPGNWASNFAAGSEFGYSLLWVVTLSTIMLIVLQHNVAHLGIVTGLCLSEAATKYTPSWVSRPILGTAVLASISTSLAPNKKSLWNPVRVKLNVRKQSSNISLPLQYTETSTLHQT
jgi:manganese transport protein